MTLLSVSALETQTPCCYWKIFFVLLITLSHQIYARFSSLEMSAIIETLMQCAEWSQFAVDYFTISLIWSKSTKLQLVEITSKHCSEAVCTLLLRVAGTITDVVCNASTSEQGTVNTLRTWRRLPARSATASDKRLQRRQSFCSPETLDCIICRYCALLSNSHAVLLCVEKTRLLDCYIMPRPLWLLQLLIPNVPILSYFY